MPVSMPLGVLGLLAFLAWSLLLEHREGHEHHEGLQKLFGSKALTLSAHMLQSTCQLVMTDARAYEQMCCAGGHEYQPKVSAWLLSPCFDSPVACHSHRTSPPKVWPGQAMAVKDATSTNPRMRCCMCFATAVNRTGSCVCWHKRCNRGGIQTVESGRVETGASVSHCVHRLVGAQQDLVKAHGGEIWAESVEGKGSTFTFTMVSAQGKMVHSLYGAPGKATQSQSSGTTSQGGDRCVCVCAYMCVFGGGARACA
eukprot:1148228-Pelagomonas_calceolata.AAC.1